MSRRVLISPLLVLAIIALVPSPVAQSFASTSNNLAITGNGDTELMELKATDVGYVMDEVKS